VQNQRERDEFRRIELKEQLERDRAVIGQYEEGLDFHRDRVEGARYELGRLDERLGASGDGL
jgi:hypothetical protein